MKRRIAAAVIAIATSLALIPADSRTDTSAAKAHAAAIARYNAYLKDHLKIKPRVEAARIMADPTPIPASLIAGKQKARAAATAADPCDGTDKPLGCQRMLWVSIPGGLAGTRQLPFTLVSKGPHTYFWVFTPQWDPTGATAPTRTGLAGTTVTQAQADDAVGRYEKVWATDRLYFGHEANPLEAPYRTPPRLPSNWRDADGDVHVNIANYPIDAGATYVAGYYSPSDEYPTEVNPTSNEGEFFYMNSAMLDVGGEDWTAVLAHEFYHMIQFAADANEETWVNEGMADVAIEVNGFRDLVQGHLGDFFGEPNGDQLNAWGGQIIDYGVAYAFLTYLVEHYGGQDDPKTPFHENYGITKAITRYRDDGFAGLDEVLADNPVKSKLKAYYRNKKIDDVYLDWTIANFLDDTTLADGQYGYYNLNGTVATVDSYSEYPASSDAQTITPYTNRYYEFASAGDGSAKATADRHFTLVNNLEGIPSGTHEYWGNRGDNSTMSMTRAADMRGTSSPHLRFSYWYDIETDWDYAYLEVSDDGGKTWHYIVCCGAKSTDPNGNNQAAADGAGITGQSGVPEAIQQVTYQADGQGVNLRDLLNGNPSWQQADVDLSSYKGKQVLVRFRYATDAAVSYPGFTVDDIDIVDGSKTIWEKDTAEKDNPAWALEGNTALTFLRITPIIENALAPQLIKFGLNTVIDRPSGKASGEKTSGGGAIDALRSILVMTSLTRGSTEEFGYQVDGNASPTGEIAAPEIVDLPKEINLPYTLKWKPASNSGKLKPKQYLVRGVRLLATTFTDDAESGLDKWDVAGSTTAPFAWDVSSDTSHSGSSSFFARMLEALPGQEATLTSKAKIPVSAAGTSELHFWSYFFGEEDSQGLVEASIDGSAWQTLTTVTHGGLPTDAVIEAADGRTMVEKIATLDAFRGKEIFIRFRLVEDLPNYVDEIPMGWYVDDIAVRSGDGYEVGRTAGTSLTLKGLPGGETAYSVVALYTDNLSGPSSEPASTRIKNGSTVRGTKTTNPRTLPATGVGSPGLGAYLLLFGSALLGGWSMRRRRTT